MWHGIAPLVGALALSYVLVRAFLLLADPAESELGASWLGLGAPAVMGLGLLLAGAALMVVWRAAGPASFFNRQPEALPGQ